MHHGGDDEVGGVPKGTTPTRWAWITLAVLFGMNLLDYMDRNVLSAVLPQLKLPVAQGGLGISNLQGGLLVTSFLVSYSIFGLLMGWAGDRFRRTYLLGAGVFVWGLATVGSGLAADFGHLVLARCFLGIGEATYGVLAPTLLIDLFPRDRRSRIMSTFYLAMPIGSAFGLVIGTRVALQFGWHNAFFVVGAPAIVAALFAFILPEPRRGRSEGIDDAKLAAHERAGATKADYLELAVNSSYTYAVFAMAAYTFAIGAMLAWVPTFLVNTRQIPQQTVGDVLGPITAVAAILGMTAGGWLADWRAKADPRALFLVPGVAMIAALPFIGLALFATQPTWIFVGIFLAEALMFVNTGPLNAVIANVVAPNLRAAAYAIAILLIHVFGDIGSPALVGWVADTFGQADMMNTAVGRAFAAIGAMPTQKPFEPPGVAENLLAGLVVVVPAIAVSGAVMLAGARHLPREMALMLARLKAAPIKEIAEV